jgi:hypothetical protein
MSERTEFSAETPRSRRSALKIAVLGSAGLLGARSARASSSTVSTLPSPVAISPIAAPPSAVRCLLRGAAVLTVRGDRKVEDLAAGDLLPTMFGGVRPIQWIGRYPMKKSNPSAPWPRDARPVRIARSALAPNVPHADLCVSQAHGVLIDGMLVSAACLVNETTIRFDDAAERDELEFFHIKMEKHDVIYVEGAPVETLLEVHEGAVNFAEYYRQYGAPTEAEVPCLPLLSHRRLERGLKGRLERAMSWADRRRRIAAIRQHLAERAASLSVAV